MWCRGLSDHEVLPRVRSASVGGITALMVDKMKKYSSHLLIALFAALLVFLMSTASKSVLYDTKWQDPSGTTLHYHESGNYFVNDELVGTWSTSDGDSRVTIEYPEVDMFGDQETFTRGFYVVGDVLFLSTGIVGTCLAYVNVEVPLSNIEQKMDEVTRPNICWSIYNWDE